MNEERLGILAATCAARIIDSRHEYYEMKNKQG